LWVAKRQQIPLFDRAFDLFFTAGKEGQPWAADFGHPIQKKSREGQIRALRPANREQAPEVESDQPWLETERSYSSLERLRQKDFAELDDSELAIVKRLMQQEVLTLAPRRTRRRKADRRGHSLDLRRTLRASLAYGGEPLKLTWRRRKEKPRPLVALADISGSMEPYGRILLQFLYLLGSASERVESFVFATRLTRLTRSLAHRNVEEALRRATDQVIDWGGGTRIGESLRNFNYTWGRRVLGQGAVVLVISDGWDTGKTELLEREVARLSRSCDRLIWLNPLLGSPGYQPLTRGIRSVLPHIDHFLPVHNLRSLEELGQVLRQLGPRDRRGG
jgi:uncharacterized protein with von Willebrand factor type A (vWA) domain